MLLQLKPHNGLYLIFWLFSHVNNKLHFLYYKIISSKPKDTTCITHLPQAGKALTFLLQQKKVNKKCRRCFVFLTLKSHLPDGNKKNSPLRFVH